MIAPIDVACPMCEAPPGSSCTARLPSPGSLVRFEQLAFHHAERIDAAARFRPVIDHKHRVYVAAIAWRRNVDLKASDPMTTHLLAVIDAAIAAQEGT